MQKVFYPKLMNSACVELKSLMSSVCLRRSYLMPSKTVKLASMVTIYYRKTEAIYLTSNLSYKCIQFSHPDLDQ